MSVNLQLELKLAETEKCEARADDSISYRAAIVLRTLWESPQLILKTTLWANISILQVGRENFSKGTDPVRGSAGLEAGANGSTKSLLGRKLRLRDATQNTWDWKARDEQSWEEKPILLFPSSWVIPPTLHRLIFNFDELQDLYF